MKTSVLVSASAYGADFVRSVGHAYLVPIVAEAGASGLEICRDLFVGEQDLDALRELLERYKLFSVYATSTPLFQDNGRLAREELDLVMEQAQQLGSRYVKVSLGHFSAGSNLLEWARFSAKAPVPLLLENDQTIHGGGLDNIASFLAICAGNGASVGMSFDMANWSWNGTDTELAARTLARHVQYVHCKGVSEHKGSLRIMPLEEDDMHWSQLFRHFPRGVQRSIGFPLVGRDLEALTRDYVHMLATPKR